jgi:hypothetical protein
VLLAGFIDLGPQSAPAQSLLHGVSEGTIRGPATAWHCCLEFYSVATRLPPEFRVSPADAVRLLFDAEGGWFTRESRSGLGLRVAGCTWGGSALLTCMIAAPGMFLEFANHVRTTRIREVRCLRPQPAATIH